MMSALRPTCSASAPRQFHARVLRRQADFPHAMLATATHDHKRGEDVRARLAVLSEKAEEWASVLPGWIERCRPLRRQSGDALLPHGGDIAMLLQTIVGAWPLDLEVRNLARAAFVRRATCTLAGKGATRSEACDRLVRAKPGL